MAAKTSLAAAILLVFAGSYAAKGFLAEASREAATAPPEPKRIVSLAPSVTETLFALGLGDRVVGVTRYCDYPPEALEKPRVGGYFNPNFEAVVALAPDLIVTTGDADRPTFDRLGLPTLVVRHTSIEGILESILAIGRACGAKEDAQRIVTDIEARLQTVRRKTEGLRRPKVLCVVQRTLGTGGLQDVYIAGQDGHLDRIIELAGGQNAYQQGTVRFPVVTTEGLFEMNPEVIVDMSAAIMPGNLDRRAMMADWQQVAGVDAVKRGQVYLIEDDYATVPGPRFILLIEQLARMIHPKADWQP